MKRFRRSTTILFPLTSQWCPDFLLNCCTFSGRCRTTSSASTGRTAVCFPHAAASQNLCHLEQAVHALESQNITAALEALYEVDNNCYAFLFDEEVYYHFTEYILHQPKDRLMWGAGRILHHENLYGLVQRLKELDQMAIPGSLDVEIRRLEAAIRRQQAYLKMIYII